MEEKSYSDRLIMAAATKVKEREYWLDKLSGELPRSHFYYDDKVEGNEDRAKKTGRGAARFKFTGEYYSDLMALSKGSDYTLHMVLLAGIIVLVAKYTGSSDIILGSPIYKQDIEAEFINTVLVLRNRFEKNSSFKELLLLVRNTVIEATENYSYPIELLADDLNIPFPEKDSLFFDIAVLLENIHDREYIRHIRPKIMISFLRSNGAVEGVLEYKTLYYHLSTIERIINHFKTLLREFLLDVDRRISAVELISAEEKRKVLLEFNSTEKEYPKDKTIPGWFENQAAGTPDKIALVYEDQQLSYGELNKRANRYAGILRRRGVKANTVTAIMLVPSIERIIVILGILKAGGACLPLDTEYPGKRISAILDNNEVSFLLTQERVLDTLSFTSLGNMKTTRFQPTVSAPRQPIKDFDGLPLVDRTLVDYEKYHHHIGIGMGKHTVSIQATRGCPYNCAFCHKLWPKKHVARSADNLYKEIRQCYDAGVTRFVFIDDIFNLDIKNSSRLLELIIKNRLDVQLLFPNGLRGDILNKDFIDLMIAAGTVNVDLALETASPRLQKLIGKNLNLGKFTENVHYFARNYPHVVLELEMIIGFPTETEEEAWMTLDFLKDVKWFHFPNLNILKIYPNTGMYRLALENGIPEELIARSTTRGYHELPETLPFSKEFVKEFQSRFVNEYFLAKERLLHVLPYQVKSFSKVEIIEKYNSYLPVEIKSFPDILQLGNISMEEWGNVGFLPGDYRAAPGFVDKMGCFFPGRKKIPGEFRILFVDLSQLFGFQSRDILYDVVEAPLGLMYLASYLHEKFAGEVCCKVIKSRIDFDSYKELQRIIAEYKPGLIGLRTLSIYKEFFHTTVSLIRQWGFKGPIAAGGPYATSDFEFILQDHNVDVLVLGEGELTCAELVEKILNNGGKLPGDNTLEQIPGLAFLKRKDKSDLKELTREILIIDHISAELALQPGENPGNDLRSNDLLYLIPTSGSTGEPKIVMLEHRNLINLLNFEFTAENIDFSDRVLHFASIGFDVSFQEIFTTLLSGGELFSISSEIKTDVPRLFDFIQKNDIGILFLPPAFLKFVFTEPEFAAAFPHSVKHIIAAGEQLIIPQQFKRYLQENQAYLHNHYGPSETHVVTTLEIDPRGNIPGVPSIGKPIYNTRIRILDEDMKTQPIGVVGELYISGANVGRGYFNRKDLTEERFSRDPIDKSQRMYRTGDLARWQPDGNIEYLGRIDHQVKIRGFRIELEEIEKKLQQHGKIKQAVVIARQDAKGDKYLCAYYVPDVSIKNGEPGNTYTRDVSPEPAALRQYLSEELPGYMLPMHFVHLRKIPLTQSGKIDRKSLPEPGMEVVQSYRAPRDVVEKKLVEIWSELLGISEDLISINANFFQLGGHSLTATIAVSKIHKELGVKIPLGELIKHQTIGELSGYIKPMEKNQYISVKPVEKREYYALSSAQKRLYFLRQLDLESTTYNMPLVLPLGKDVEKDKLESTLKKLIARHESLRTSFFILKEDPVQKIHKTGPFEIDYYRAENNVNIEGIIHLFIRPFDLSQAPLIRSGLIRHPDNYHTWMVDIHHIVSDGISHTILTEDFISLYNGKELEALKLQYKDFSQWQNRLSASGDIKAQQDYWLDLYPDPGEIPRLELPTDYQRPKVFTFAGDRYDFKLEREDAVRFKALALRNGATLYMNILAVLNTLFYKYTGETDIIIGSGTAGRPHADLQRVIGMFINTLSTRNYPQGEKSYQSFLKEVISISVKAFENQDVQFEELVDNLNLERDPSRNPLFDISMVVQNFRLPGEDMYGGIREEFIGGKSEDFPTLDIKYKNTTAKFDMTFFIHERGEDVYIGIEYYTGIFKESTIQRLESHLKRVIKAVIREPAIKLKDIDIIPGEEKKKVLYDFNNSAGEDPGNKTLPQLFEEQVEKTPDNAALVFQESETQSINFTYLEINGRVNQLACQLQARGVNPDNIVGILTGSSIKMVIGLLGILKSGGAYLPLDPEYPPERITALLEDSNVGILVTDGKRPQVTRLSKGLEMIAVDTAALNSNIKPAAVSPGPSDMAYAIYTSGTTGSPKGILIRQRGVINYTRWRLKTYKYTREDVTLGMLSYCFDGFGSNFYSSLLSGGKLVIIPDLKRLDIEFIKAVIKRHKVTNMSIVPSTYRMILDSVGRGDLRSLRFVVLAGEKSSAELIKKSKEIEPGLLLVNEYGPTEVTVTAAGYSNINESNTAIIGKPIANTRIYIFDAFLKPVPVNVTGELYVTGPGIARGYLNNPELTSRTFIKSLFAHEERMYRTGDLARWLSAGNIEFLGRRDHQVKIRGFRIELAEIESQLLKHEDIKEAFVLTKEAAGNRYLSAFLVAKRELRVSRLREYLSKVLPPYMIPSYYVQVEKIPLTANGKVDRRALPSNGIQLDTGIEFVAPRNEIEEKIAEIWKEVLGLEKVGIHENFFDLGGNSYDIIKLNTRIKQVFDEEDNVARIFTYTTISSFARYLSQKKASEKISPPADTRKIPIARIKKRRSEQKSKRKGI